MPIINFTLQLDIYIDQSNDCLHINQVLMFYQKTGIKIISKAPEIKINPMAFGFAIHISQGLESVFFFN